MGNERLREIDTQWIEVLRAQNGEKEAQLRVLDRYSAAIYRYLRASVRDPDLASELAQEFIVRFLDGSFRKVNPERGRFRDYVKTVLYHLIVDHQNDQKTRPRQLGSGVKSLEETHGNPQKEFEILWREDLLNRALKKMRTEKGEPGRALPEILRLRMRNPDASCAALANKLSKAIGKQVTEQAFRQALHRARQKFAELVLEEVSQSLVNPSSRELEQELIDLQLLPFCRSALERRAGNIS